MIGQHHHLNGHEFEQTLGDSEEQGSRGCCSPWDHNELDTTQQVNNDTHARVWPGLRNADQDQEAMAEALGELPNQWGQLNVKTNQKMCQVPWELEVPEKATSS